MLEPEAGLYGYKTRRKISLNVGLKGLTSSEYSVFNKRRNEYTEAHMSKTITMRLDDDVYQTFRTLAERDNRPLSNFIETAALRFIRDNETVDSYEMAEIRGNSALNASLKRGVKDAKTRRGSFV